MGLEGPPPDSAKLVDWFSNDLFRTRGASCSATDPHSSSIPPGTRALEQGLQGTQNEFAHHSAINHGTREVFTAKHCELQVETERTKIAKSQSLAISALTEPNRQTSRRKKGFRAQKSQPEIANRWRLSIAPLNRNAALAFFRKSLAISGVRDRHHRLRFRCAKG